MDNRPEPFETLKQILRQVRDPQALDDHPWTRSLIVQEVASDAPGSERKSPGQRLIDAIARLFPRLQPSTPPKRGKRLDPRWGEFGLLAALYFTPFNHGTPYPTSFTDAWGRIDPAILYFVFGKPAETLHEDDVKKYQLVGADLEYASASTLSDWHRKGVQRLTDEILDRERFLSRSHARPSAILEPEKAQVEEHTRPRHAWRWFGLGVFLLLILALGFGLFKGWKVYQSGLTVYRDVTALREQVHPPLNIKTAQTVIPQLTTLQTDLAHLKQEARPFLGLTPWLRWVPEYGNDLGSTPALFNLSEHLLKASLLSSQAAGPLLDQMDAVDHSLDFAGLTTMLVQAEPQLKQADAELQQAITARKTLDPAGLSPRLQSLLVDDLDPLLKLADEGLSLATTLPQVLGAGSSGPKTYLLLAQNEDELRPTGGFITSVGNLVLYNGEVISLKFDPVENEDLEDWTKPYPAAPWQLQEYMNSRVLILRDANWFSDYPTAATWVEYLYAYSHDHSVDGVIAFDQQFLVMLLEELGPLDVEGAPYPITQANVIEYMRQAKIPPSGDTILPDWYRKEFISKMGDAMLKKLDSGGHDWYGLARILTRALDERHLLLQFDDPQMTTLTARRGWDGAIRPSDGDYLLVTDSNIGFNKTNAVVEASLSYDVDLTDVKSPQSTLVATQKNNAKPGVPCIHWDSGAIEGEAWYPIDRCYWDYLRVYKQTDSQLLSATPHAIPGEWMLLGQDVPARVDDLDEDLTGARGYGTLLMVPGGDSQNTSFQFALPETVISQVDSTGPYVYRLRVQKQPGTLAQPLTIRVHLPAHATLVSSSREAVVQDHNLLVQTDLQTDVDLEVMFTLP
jgi:hypothetical protein